MLVRPRSAQPSFEHSKRGLRPRSAQHCAKWDNILQPTGTTNALQDHLVETKLRCIAARTQNATRLGGSEGSNLGRLYDSWEMLTRFHSQRYDSGHAEIVINARKELRRHPMVSEELNSWWKMILATFPAMCDRHGAAQAGMDIDQYIRWQLCMYKVLSPFDNYGHSTFDREKAEARAVEDYQLDLKGDQLLHKKGFCDALFALADLWTLGVHPGEYAMFLSSLFRAVCCTTDQGGFVLNKIEEIEDRDWNLSELAQRRFAPNMAAIDGQTPRNHNVYKSGTSASNARIAALKAEREAKEAPPPELPKRPPSPVLTSAAVGPQLVHGRLRSAPASARLSTPSHRKAPDSPSKGLKWRPIGIGADANQWFERAQQWFAERGEPTGALFPPAVEHVSLQSSTPHSQLSPRNAGLTQPPLTSAGERHSRPASPRPPSKPRSRPTSPRLPAGAISRPLSARPAETRVRPTTAPAARRIAYRPSPSGSAPAR